MSAENDRTQETTPLSLIVIWILLLALFCVSVLIAVTQFASDEHYPALMVIEGRSELISVGVTDARRMDFEVQNVRAQVDDQYFDCVTAAFHPAIGTQVTFERLGRNSPLIIEISAPTANGAMAPESFMQEAGADGYPFASAILEMDHDRAGPCTSPAQQVFILAGQVSVGSELAPALPVRPPLLLSGHVRTFGRAASEMGLLPLDWGPMQPDALYQMDQIVLPPGTRIAPAIAGQDGSAASDAQYSYSTGMLELDLDQGSEAGFLFSVSANARMVDLFLPAPRWASGEGDEDGSGSPDRLYISSGIQILNDPNIGWLVWIAGIVFAVVTVPFVVVTYWRRR